MIGIYKFKFWEQFRLVIKYVFVRFNENYDGIVVFDFFVIFFIGSFIFGLKFIGEIVVGGFLVRLMIDVFFI